MERSDAHAYMHDIVNRRMHFNDLYPLMVQTLTGWGVLEVSMTQTARLEADSAFDGNPQTSTWFIPSEVLEYF